MEYTNVPYTLPTGPFYSSKQFEPLHMIWYISVGETGSGKSTQCSNYILEDAIQAGKGGETSIMVTQPR